MIWDFAGEPIPTALLADVQRLLDGGVPPGLSTLLTVEEGDALLHRARRLVDTAVFPTDHTGMRYPWPLV